MTYLTTQTPEYIMLFSLHTMMLFGTLASAAATPVPIQETEVLIL